MVTRFLILLFCASVAFAAPNTPINNLVVQKAGVALGAGLLQGNGTSPVTKAVSTDISAALDLIGSTRGSILYRGAAGWSILTPGTSGYSLVSNGAGSDPSYQLVAANTALSAITAATGSNTIASGNNTGQVWNWANTTDSTVAMTLGETTAATNGTTSSGIPNQALFKLSTLASSTQSPLQVFSRGAQVMAISATTNQIYGGGAAAGTAAAPLYSFANATSNGMFSDSNGVGISSGGTQSASFRSNQLRVLSGTSSIPGITDIATGNVGFFWTGAHSVAVGDATGGEVVRFTAGATPAIAASYPIVPASYTVATLPTAASYTYGIVAVSDANEAAGTGLGTAPTGGGTVKRMVYSDGTNWLLM